MEWRLMETTLKQLNTVRRWGIYHAEREFAREMVKSNWSCKNSQVRRCLLPLSR